MKATFQRIQKITLLTASLLLLSCASVDRQVEAPSPSAPAKDITVALLGATGMVGGHLLQDLLSHGYTVRALARTPQKLAAYQEQVSIVHGDATDIVSIDTLLAGSDVVVSALGPVRGDGDAAKTISTTATGLIIDSMERHHIDRYILVSGAAVTLPGDDRNLTGRMVKRMASIALSDAVKDKQVEYGLLAQSSIAWTILRCPMIADEPYESPAIASLKTPTSFSLRAGDLARFVIEQIDSDEFVREGPFLNSD